MNKKSDWQEVFDKVKWQDLSENLDIDQDEAEAGIKLLEKCIWIITGRIS